MPDPAAGWIDVCASADVDEGGDARRFDVALELGRRQAPATGFVIRHGGRAIAWLNQCRHVPMELDWQPGRVFDENREYLVCATHGALYRPDDGVCVSGPCTGARLRPIVVLESDGRIAWQPDLLVKAPCHHGAPATDPAPPPQTDS
ncbi:Rieske 2Fe-2S domain-containing protein [soil metagenome]